MIPQMSPLGWAVFPFVMVVMMVLVLMVLHDFGFCKEFESMEVKKSGEKEW